jgi:hypothetical protein
MFNKYNILIYYYRQDLIDLYNNDNEIFVFLLSTRAGGMLIFLLFLKSTF